MQRKYIKYAMNNELLAIEGHSEDAKGWSAKHQQKH